MNRVPLLRLLHKEWISFYREKSNIVILVLFALCLSFGAWNGIHKMILAEKATKAAIENDSDSFAKKISLLKQINEGVAKPGRWNDPSKAHQGVLHAKRPATPWPAEMGFMSAEDDPLTPFLTEVGMSTRHTNPDPVFEDPSQRQDGPFDLIFVVVWLSPLIIILLSYDVLARDRELGQARVLASQNVSLRKIVVARLIVRMTCVTVLVATVIVFALIVSPNHSLSNFIAASIWIIGLVLFLGFWISLCALINGINRNAATAGQVLLAIWAGLTLIVPLLIGVIAKLESPPIDRFDTILAYRALSNELNQRRDDIKKDFFIDAPISNSEEALDDEYAEYFVTVFYPMQLAFDKQYQDISASIENQRKQQLDTLRLGAFASPALALKLLSDDLAGNSPERRIAFFKSVDSFQDKWRAAFEEKVIKVLPLTVEDYELKPEFVSRQEDFWIRWLRIVFLLLALILPTSIFALLAWRALQKVKP